VDTRTCLSIVDRRVHRFGGDAETIQMITQTRVPGMSVAQVAGRRDVNTNLFGMGKRFRLSLEC
jgi:hypothetical protein